MPEKDLYEILGVQKNASDADIKKAYRRSAQKHHPDRNKGDKTSEQKFKDINNAYQVLSDRQKRSQYDQFGSASNNPPNFGGGFQGGGFDFSSFGGSFSDIFETFFGGESNTRGRRRNRKTRGRDIETSVNITFEESAFGCEKIFEITKLDTCNKCQGTGSEPGIKISTCPICHGTGEIRSIQQTILGQIATSMPCNNCHGEGRIPEKKCSNCKGETVSRTTENVKVKIPSGIDDSSTIRLSGKGEAGAKNGGYGDLYIHIIVLPHKEFKRKDSDIYSNVNINVLQAILGDEVGINTLHGKVILKVPSGTQSGKLFKIANKGIQKIRTNDLGDHYVKINVEIPQKLSSEERALYFEIAKIKGLDIKEQKRGWF